MKYTQKKTTTKTIVKKAAATSNAFSKALDANATPSFTANGARTLASTGQALLDFFSVSGAMRSRNEADIIKLFSNAFNEDRELAVRALFYCRDARGGQGERRTFSVCLKWLHDYHHDVFLKVFSLIPDYGYWRDLINYVNVSEVVSLVRETLASDIANLNANKPVSLLGKWLPSENASSKQTRNLARRWMSELHMTPKQYRKTLSRLRESSNVVERPMSANCWDQIVYENVASKATIKYRKAFRRHDEVGYNTYLQQVASGEKTIKTSVTYPYEVVGKILEYGSSFQDDQTLQLVWDNLPDYFNGKQENSIVVVDTSGSMYSGQGCSRPINISVSLGIYAAQRNTGAFHNKFITFSDRPTLETLQGNNITEIIRNMSQANWGYNTNVEAVFRLLLDTAVNFNISQEEMIKKIYIISDMQFDQATTGNKTTHFRSMKKMYKEAGYELPQIVYWNVNSGKDGNYQVAHNEQGVQLVSGASPTLFEDLLKESFRTPVDFMMEVLNKPRYASIVLN